MNDFISFAEWAKARHPSLPLSIISHSMGTVVTMNAINKIPAVSSIIFSATPLFPGPGSASPQGLTILYPVTNTSCAPYLVKKSAQLDPNGPAAPISLEGITPDLREQAILLSDPLRYPNAIRNITAYEVSKMIEAAKLEIPNITVPFLCIHGTKDTLALVKGSQYLFDSAGTHADLKTIKIYEGYCHELFHEIPSVVEESLKDATDYIEASLFHHINTALVSSTIDVSVV